MLRWVITATEKDIITYLHQIKKNIKLDKALGVCLFNIYRWDRKGNNDPFRKYSPHIEVLSSQ